VRNWLKNVLGGGPPNNPEVPDVWIEGLRGILAPLRKWKGKVLPAGLDDRTIEYVLSGEPLSVLNELQSPDVEEAVFGYSVGSTDDDFDKAYGRFDDVPAEVGLRWARALEAMAKVTRYNFPNFLLPGGVTWPELLLLNATATSYRVWSSKEKQRLNYTTFERLFEAAGMEKAALLVSAFSSPAKATYGVSGLQKVKNLLDYPEALERHLEKIRPHLLPAMAAQRVHVLELLDTALPQTVTKMAAELADLAVSSSKQVRNLAEIQVKRTGNAAVEPLRDFAQRGKPEQRQFALRLLHEHALKNSDDALRAWSRETAQADKAESVRALIGEWDSLQQSAAAPNTSYEYAVPKIDWSSAATPEMPALLDSLWRTMNEIIDVSNRRSREHHERMVAQGHKYPLHQMPQMDGAKLKMLKALMADGKAPAAEYGSDSPNWHVTQEIPKFAANGKLPPAALYKLLAGLNLLERGENNLNHTAAQAFNALYASRGGFTLLEVSQMFADGSVDPTVLLRSYCSQYSGIGHGWRDADVWPFFAHHVDELERLLLSGSVAGYWFDREMLYQAIATLPTPPARIVNALFSVALGTGKSERPAAQAALAAHPDKEARIIHALSDGKAEIRTSAAQWLGRLKHAPAVPALTRAVMAEKHDTAKGAMLDALEALGEPVEKFLKRDALVTEAKKVLAKGIPKDLEWFPWSALPEVHWADTKEQVPVDVLRWMLVQAVRQKSAEPNAVLRKYCAMFEPREREQFGQMILDSWLRHDVTPISAEEAHSRAKSNAQSTFGFMQSHPQYWKDNPLFGKSEAELMAYFLPGFLRTPAGSAIASKGVLAVAAACAGERAGAPVGRYIKEWYGTRAAQGKALIAMLAWIEHPSATQVMLAIGNRFRTKSLQEEATKQAEALAERRGWSLGELADRTIPSAGFDENGELELSYGTRSFTAKLLPDFKVELYNPEGKKVASLSEPRQDDDAELAKESKKSFSAAKKEIKAIVDLQTDRLYEALCTERAWPYAEWQEYLNRHPVVRHLTQRLVWIATVDGKPVVFRPLDDGTLTDHEDEAVELPADASVRVAHDSLLSPEDVAHWQQHLVDYEIKPLFQQLGKGTWKLPEAQAKAREIKDFEGHMIEAFALRGRALKLGYTRGAAEDGGWFHLYQKRFPTLGLTAVIEFTGNPLPEENRAVALISLSFASTQSQHGATVALGKVPSVLLSECFNDLRLIANEGTGFDADWQKKSEY